MKGKGDGRAMKQAQKTSSWSGVSQEQRTRQVGELLKLVPGWLAAWHAPLSQGINEYWDLPLHIQLLSVRPASAASVVLNGPSFSVEKPMALAEAPPWSLKLKLSEALCGALLEQTLGPKPEEASSGKNKAFRLNETTALEQHLLRRFGLSLLKHITDTVGTWPVMEEEPPAHSPLIQLGWCVGLSAGSETAMEPWGGFTLSLPYEALYLAVHKTPNAGIWPKAGLPHLAEQRLWQSATTTVLLCAGTTELTLQECNHIETGDWLVLDKSAQGYLALCHPVKHGVLKGFPITVGGYQPPEQALDEEEEQEASTMATNAPKQGKMPSQQGGSPHAKKEMDFLEQLNVDVHACFEPLKLPLSQVRQMGEGLLVEVGDLLQNKIYLQVNGNTLAEGELMVVGDKFGVLVTKLYGRDEEPEPKLLILPTPNQPAAPEADTHLVAELNQLGLNPQALIQAATESGQDVNRYLAQVLEDHHSNQNGGYGEGQQDYGSDDEGEYMADDAMAEVDRLLSED
jgi:flagellar motor switch protein FliN